MAHSYVTERILTWRIQLSMLPGNSSHDFARARALSLSRSVSQPHHLSRALSFVSLNLPIFRALSRSLARLLPLSLSCSLAISVSVFVSLSDSFSVVCQFFSHVPYTKKLCHLYVNDSCRVYVNDAYQTYEKVIQSGPENPSGNFVFLYKKTKTFAGTDLSHCFNLVRYGSQTPLFDALQLRKWHAGQRVLSADSTQGTFWDLQSHKLFYSSCGRQGFSCGSYIQKKNSHARTTHMAPPRSTFARGWPDVRGTLGQIWVMSHIYELVMPLTWMSHVSYVWMMHVQNMNESCRIYGCVMSHIWMSQVANMWMLHFQQMNESCHGYE